MSDINISMAVGGIADLLRKLQLTNAATRDRTKAAIVHGTREVAAKARMLVPKRSGALAHTIRDEYSKDGMAGYVKAGYGTLLRRSKSSNAARVARHQAQLAARSAKYSNATSSRQAQSALDLGVYAPVVERGDPRRHHRPHPYVIPALASSRDGIIRDLELATVQGARDGGAL